MQQQLMAQLQEQSSELTEGIADLQQENEELQKKTGAKKKDFNRIIPILKKLCAKLRAIYAKYISLRDENKKLNIEIDRLENISDRRQGTIIFLRNENEELREKANDLARVRGLAGDQAVDQLIAEAKYREEMERQAKRMSKRRKQGFDL